MLGIILEEKNNSDFENNFLNGVSNQKKLNNHISKSLISDESEARSIISDMKKYDKMKNQFSIFPSENLIKFGKQTPIVILNPGYDATEFVTEKICVGNIVR